MAEEIGSDKTRVAEKVGSGKTRDELGMLRDILLEPVFAQIERRDKKVLEFIEQLSSDLVSRVNNLQAQLNALKDEIQHRDKAVADVADGIANLGSELRKVMAKPESGQGPQESREPTKAA